MTKKNPFAWLGSVLALAFSPAHSSAGAEGGVVAVVAVVVVGGGSAAPAAADRHRKIAITAISRGDLFTTAA